MTIDLTTPLVTSKNDGPPSPNYGPLTKLLGTWNSSVDHPTGYNVMPVPAGNVQGQPPALDDFQNKNFYYYEEMTFTAPGEAPNRGQDFQQGCYAVTYEQRVYFAPAVGIGGLPEEPAVPPANQNTLVHFENGIWSHMDYEAQPVGAYAPPTLPAPTVTQPADLAICKQVSVPHGNSIQAVGSFKTYDGPPTFDTSTPDEKPFNIPGEDIPNPTIVLAMQLEKLGTVKTTTELSVTAEASVGGGVANMIFEKGNSDVSGYEMTLYILDLEDGSTVLQYVQKIPMTFYITTNPNPDSQGMEGTPTVFSHITANTLTKVS